MKKKVKLEYFTKLQKLQKVQQHDLKQKKNLNYYPYIIKKSKLCFECKKIITCKFTSYYVRLHFKKKHFCSYLCLNCWFRKKFINKKLKFKLLETFI